MRARDDASSAAASTLAAGMALSLLLLAAGLAAALLRGEPLPAAAPPASALLSASASGRADGLLALGLVVLLATPALRVLALAWAFARRREWAMLAASCSVLAVLGLSVVAGRGH